MNTSSAGLITIAVVLGLLCMLGLVSCTEVPAGHVGIVTSFGEVSKEPLDAGLHFVAFWKHVERMSLKTQEDQEYAQVPTKEGLSVKLECSLLFSLNRDKAVEVFRTVGPKYKDIIVTPQFRSALRGATVGHQAKDLYTVNRVEIEKDLEKVVKEMLEARGVNCERVLLRSIELPETVKKAIEAKLASEQEAQRMEFVLQKEEKEAARKRIEAKGIADSQHIIQGTLSDAYLRYLWIESLKYAGDNGATTIYIPTGMDGMPIFKEASSVKAAKK